MNSNKNLNKEFLKLEQILIESQKDYEDEITSLKNVIIPNDLEVLNIIFN